jgi:DNA polymerase-3 subunit alpha
MAAKASIKSVARVLGYSYSFGDRLAKLIPSKPVDISLKMAIFENPDTRLKDLYEKDDEVRNILDIALRLEGITISNGKHAGGVVISPTCITDFAPLMCDSEGLDFKTQFDKHDVEEAGLVKFDFLGLKTLTIVDWAIEMINKRLEKEGKELVDISKISLSDPQSYEVLKTGETTAVFQLESKGMRELIRKLQPDCFEDIIALVALYRPGPLNCGMVDNFVNRKHGLEPVAYPHPDFQHPCLKPILEPTYGIVVYQEQVMQIAQALAGYSLGGADLLRRAMGKKKPEEMAKQRGVFKAGAEAKGVDGELAMKIFDQVEKFAGYGFNKSHSAAYALVSFQTLWLKTHYPAEFLAAMMTADKEKAEKMVIYIHECRRLGIKVLPPSVNEGQIHFIVNDKGEIVYSLGAIKGVGEGPVAEIMRQRKENGPFKSFYDFARRVDGSVINKRILEALVAAGAMDGLGPHRASLNASIDTAIKLSQEAKQNKISGDYDIFAAFDEDYFEEPPYVQVKPYDDKTWRNGEVITLGLYLTGHPIDKYSKEIPHITKYSLSELHPAEHSYGEEKVVYTAVGIVVKTEQRKTKDGKKLMSCILEDYTGKISLTLWENEVDKYTEIIKENELIIVSGTIGFDNFNKCSKINYNNIMTIAQARGALAKSLRIFVNDENLTKNNMVERVADLAQKNPGPLSLEVVLEHKNGVLISPSAIRVNPNDEFLEELKYLTGYDAIVMY